MSEQFKVGEVCIVVWSDYFPELEGTEVIITGPLRPCYNPTKNQRWFGYDTDIRTFAPLHRQLRKRTPPANKGELAFMSQVHQWTRKDIAPSEVIA